MSNKGHNVRVHKMDKKEFQTKHKKLQNKTARLQKIINNITKILFHPKIKQLLKNLRTLINLR
jgi:hypothetical protein